jgi:glycosyltransferase involved in cell wall biosynthesis
MKIGVIHPSLDVVGGAEKTTFALIETLKNTQHVSTLFTTSKKNPPSSQNFIIKSIHRNPLPIFWRIQRLLENRKLLKLAENNDVVIIMSGGLVLENIASQVLLYCHSTFESELNYANSNKKTFNIYDFLIKKKIKNQIKILNDRNVSLISNSEFTRSKIKHNFGKDSLVIYPPVDLLEFKNLEKKERKGAVVISRYSKEKNLEFTLEVLKELPFEAKIIGNALFQSQFEIFNRLKEMVKNKSNIELMCNVKRSVINSVLSSSKVFFHASPETFGIAVVEGIAAGCIPIVPDNSANRETVPFKELRYEPNNVWNAKNLILKANSGKLDEFVPKLQHHIQKYDSSIFKKKILEYIEQFK